MSYSISELETLSVSSQLTWSPQMWYNFNSSSDLYTVQIDANRQIRCYNWYDLWYTPLNEGTSTGNYTKCMQVGSGWGPENKRAYFGVEGKYDENVRGKVTPGVDVNIYSSGKVTYFPNGTMPSWLPEGCLQNSTQLNQTQCDWNRLFAVDPDSPMANRSVSPSSDVSASSRLSWEP